MYIFDNSCGTLSVTIHLELSADDVTRPSTERMTVGCLFLNNGAKILLLDVLYRLVGIEWQHAVGDVVSIQQHILVCLIVAEERVALNETEKIRLRELANMLTVILRRNSTFLNLMKTILNFTVAFQKKYNDQFITILIVQILIYMVGFRFLRARSAQSYYRYLRGQDDVEAQECPWCSEKPER